MGSFIERGVLWNQLLDRKHLKVDARHGLLHDSVKIYRITKGELKELIGRREAPQVLLLALEQSTRRKEVAVRNLVLGKAEVLAAAQAIVKEMLGLEGDLQGGMKEVLGILREMVEKERASKEKEK